MKRKLLGQWAVVGLLALVTLSACAKKNNDKSASSAGGSIATSSHVSLVGASHS